MLKRARENGNGLDVSVGTQILEIGEEKIGIEVKALRIALNQSALRLNDSRQQDVLASLCARDKTAGVIVRQTDNRKSH